ncbi:MAG: ATP-dependent DNA helicase RecG [Anaerolineae bacterium]|nr:ATP-dependent DNA helicase RecG [Thermoflexus sp.]MDW8064677.1 ATP-dependent DNA helicase RecG [Anaerolineae bacterium]
MASPFTQLQKILSHEVQDGYRNRIVIGGIGRFADHWYRQARAALKERDPDVLLLLESIYADLRRYEAANPEERRQLIEEVEARIREALQRERELRITQPTPEAKDEPAVPPSLEPAPASSIPSGEKSRGKPSTLAPPLRRGRMTSTRSRSRAVPPIPSKLVGKVEALGLDAPVHLIHGVGRERAQRLSRLGVQTVRDLLYLLPRRYVDFRALKPIHRLRIGEEVTVIGEVMDIGSKQTGNGLTVIRALLTDGSAVIECTWFNQPYLLDRIRPGQFIVVSGRVDEFLGRPVFRSPEWEPADRELLHTARIVPIYPLTEGLTQRLMRSILKRVVDYWADRVEDPIPAWIREAYGFPDLPAALKQVHFPEDWEPLEKARRRLAFDEVFYLQIGLLEARRRWRSVPGRALAFDESLLQRAIEALPFSLTGAQRRALDQILADLRFGVPMNRLLQGEVGSGKTVVAALAAYAAFLAGTQAAVMAPTEILVEQHHRTFLSLIERWASAGLPTPTIRMLTSGVSGFERTQIYGELAGGTCQLVVGTHALIQEGVTFQDLALVVIDEQQRFGVLQRAALRGKGYNPHVLVMTATPIPRTLALTLYGDLDLSVIDEMPPGRQPVLTRWLMPEERERAYTFIRRQVEQGRQAYIICPLVEGSDKIEAKAAVEEYERLQREIFPDLRLGLIHGRMKSEEKEAVMSAFARGEIQILVATPVVEVGVDVPNATVILIEGADRFGLAQLHQFRGRVGRGSHPSYCLLLAESPSDSAIERLRAIETIYDGFQLAQKDLEMRGPGDFLGTRQSGFPEMRLADLTDLRLLEIAREAAERLAERDPDLKAPEHYRLAEAVSRFWHGPVEPS